MNRVRPRVAGLGKQVFGFDDLVDFCLQRVFHVDDVDPAGPDARYDQVPAFQKGVTGQRRQRGRARVPAEMVKFVAFVGHEKAVNDLAVFL